MESGEIVGYRMQILRLAYDIVVTRKQDQGIAAKPITVEEVIEAATKLRAFIDDSVDV